jgi:hypothetical protein
MTRITSSTVIPKRNWLAGVATRLTRGGSGASAAWLAVSERETIAADASIVTRSAHLLAACDRFGPCDPVCSGRSAVARSSSAASRRSAMRSAM